MKTWKRFLPDVLVVVLFAVISFAYFFVPVTQGKILYRHDASAGVGSAQEMTEYQNRTGEATRWTNAIFGGEIPGAAPRDCGNYLLHDLPMAKWESRKFLTEVLDNITDANLVYPEK